jgi:hypothetical protein
MFSIYFYLKKLKPKIVKFLDVHVKRYYATTFFEYEGEKKQYAQNLRISGLFESVLGTIPIKTN